jgi:3-oxoacyl-[acyl-carrier protein] reductase
MQSHDNPAVKTSAGACRRAGASWERIGAVLGTLGGYEARKRLVARNGGRVIVLSSGTTGLRPPTYGPYAASKAAVEIFVNILAKELAGRMISVNAVAPGTTNTTLFTHGKTEKQIAEFAARTPHQRLGEPADIANVVSILCSERGGWINGQVIHANGGLV